MAAGHVLASLCNHAGTGLYPGRGDTGGILLESDGKLFSKEGDRIERFGFTT